MGNTKDNRNIVERIKIMHKTGNMIERLIVS